MAKVIEILKNYLVENGYDGLAGGGCGCDFKDFTCCDEGIPYDCEAAHKVYCKTCDFESCQYDSYPGRTDAPGIWCMRASKPDADAKESEVGG